MLLQTHAAALQQKDQQLDQLKALICRLQQQPSAAALFAEQTEQGGLDGGHASAPAPDVSPSTCSAGDLQGEHAAADAFMASTKKRKAAADESGQQPADESGLQNGEFMHAHHQAEPDAKRAYTGLGGQDSLAAAPEPEQAAGACASPEAAAAVARSMRALHAGTYKLAGSNSTTPTKPPEQQQQQPPGQAARSAHPSTDAAASAPLPPTSLQLVLAAAMQTAGSMPSGAAGAQGQSAGQPAQAMQAAAEQDAGDMSGTEQDTSAGDVEADLDAADLLFFAAADPSTAQQGQQEPQHRPAIQPAPQNPAAGAIPQAGFDAQEAFATILGYLQKHGSAGNNAVRGPSSARLARAPGSAGGNTYGVGGSDGGSAASAFHPARPASAAGAAPHVDSQRFVHGGMSLSPAGLGAAGRSSAAGAAADLAAASAAAAQAAAQQQLGSSMPFGFSGPSHTMHASAGYGHPSMQGNPASLQHMLGSLGYAAPTRALQQSTAAQAYGYPGASAGAAAAAGQAYGYQDAAAAPGVVGYGGAWEGWQQMQSMQGGIMVASADAEMLGGIQQMAPGRRSFGSSAGGGSTAPARRCSKGTKSAASAGDPDDPPESAGESNVSAAGQHMAVR